ncbi:MAG: DUF3565 domain-containing protein [Acidobacteriota bacterium]|nr:DUF3565 domain-containing protein [Acidobacteriota bacterium]
MKRKIVGFDKDNESDWRAELDCGHFQHVRHKPPLVSREWVSTELGRQEKLGAELNCKKCDEKNEFLTAKKRKEDT